MTSSGRPVRATVRGFGGMLVLACVAAALAALAAVQWWSWYQLSESEQYVERIARIGWIDDEGAWHKHREALRTIEALAPFDALVHWRLGELEHWRAAGLRLWPEQQRGAFETARQHYLRAVARAPSDGVQLTRIAYRLVRTDESLALALMRRAMNTAPFEPLAQYHLAHVGLGLSEELDGPMEQSFQKMLAHAMENSKLAPRIKEMARRYERSELLSRLTDVSVD